MEVVADGADRNFTDQFRRRDEVAAFVETCLSAAIRADHQETVRLHLVLVVEQKARVAAAFNARRDRAVRALPSEHR